MELPNVLSVIVILILLAIALILYFFVFRKPEEERRTKPQEFTPKQPLRRQQSLPQRQRIRQDPARRSLDEYMVISLLLYGSHDALGRGSEGEDARDARDDYRAYQPYSEISYYGENEYFFYDDQPEADIDYFDDLFGDLH